VGLNLKPYIDMGLLKMIYVSPIELDVDEHVYGIQKLTRESKAQRLVIDSISSFEIACRTRSSIRIIFGTYRLF
jgi:circadian clock protein KaiC